MMHLNILCKNVGRLRMIGRGTRCTYKAISSLGLIFKEREDFYKCIQANTIGMMLEWKTIIVETLDDLMTTWRSRSLIMGLCVGEGGIPLLEIMIKVRLVPGQERH